MFAFNGPTLFASFSTAAPKKIYFMMGLYFLSTFVVLDKEINIIPQQLRVSSHIGWLATEKVFSKWSYWRK